MTFTRSKAGIPALAAALALCVTPSAFAQEAGNTVNSAAIPPTSGDDRVNMVMVYGDDQCPQSSETELVVCARLDEGERYRIPKNLRDSSDPANNAWATRVEQFETVGATGVQSCSPTGPGGITGCTEKMIKAAYAEKAQSSDVRFGRLINQARSERLSEIDDVAAEEQARVEQIERAYLERLERERAAAVPEAPGGDLPAIGEAASVDSAASTVGQAVGQGLSPASNDVRGAESSGPSTTPATSAESVSPSAPEKPNSTTSTTSPKPQE